MKKKKKKKKENKKQQQEFVVAREGRLEKPDLCRIVWNSNNGLLAGNLVEMDWTDRLAHPGDVLTQNRGVSTGGVRLVAGSTSGRHFCNQHERTCFCPARPGCVGYGCLGLFAQKRSVFFQ